MPTKASPTLQGALKDGFGKAVMACDVPEPFKFLSLDTVEGTLISATAVSSRRMEKQDQGIDPWEGHTNWHSGQ